MSSLASLTDRVALYLQDQTYEGWTRTQMEMQVGEEIKRLARQELFGALVWRQGVAGQAQYVLPDATVAVADVLYGGHPLRRVGEDGLARLRRDWETRHATPEYYTLALQPSQVVRLVPQPLFGGAAPVPAGSLNEAAIVGVRAGAPAMPLGGWAVVSEHVTVGRVAPEDTGVPFDARLEHNLTLFTWETPSGTDGDSGLLNVCDDIVVFNAVGELCGQATPYHDLEKSTVFKQLGRLLLERVLA